MWSAVVVRDILCSSRISLDTGGIESTAVRIRRVDGTVITVVAMYLRPQDALTETDLVPILNISNGGGSLLIGTDLNAKHSSCVGSVYNRNGNWLRNVLLPLRMCRTDSPTFLSGIYSSYLDILMATLDKLTTA